MVVNTRGDVGEVICITIYGTGDRLIAVNGIHNMVGRAGHSK